MAERRARIAELLTVEGDPAIPTRLRASVKSLQTSGAPADLMAVDAEIFRAWGGLIPPDQQQAVENAMAEMTDDPAIVASIAANMRRLDEVAALPPDHPEIMVLARDFADLLQAQLPQLVAGDDPGTNPDVDWLIQDLLSERLTPTQVVVMRGMIEYLRAANDPAVAKRDPTPPS